MQPWEPVPPTPPMHFLRVPHPLCLCRDEEEAPGPPATAQPTALTNALYLRKNNNPFLTLSHDPAAQIYRQGPLARKVHAEVDGKKSECRGHAAEPTRRVPRHKHGGAEQPLVPFQALMPPCSGKRGHQRD